MSKNAKTRFETVPRNRLAAEFSLWSADLVRMADDMARVDDHVDMYHLDAADGHFSPAFLLFPDLVAAVRKRTSKPLHVHIMARDEILSSQAAQFAEAGADVISVHAENANAKNVIDEIQARGLIAGIVLQVQTPVAQAAPFLKDIGILTLLGTRIGVKGQDLDPAAPGRLQEARQMIRQSGCDILLAADGGIREHTVPKLRQASADTIVMGSLAFNAPDLPQRMQWVREMRS